MTLLATHTGSVALARAMRRPESRCYRVGELAATLLWQLQEAGENPLEMLECLTRRLDHRIAADPHGSGWAHAALLEILGPDAVALLARRLRSVPTTSICLSVRDPTRRHYRLYALVVLALEDLARNGRPAREALMAEIKLHCVRPSVESLVALDRR